MLFASPMPFDLAVERLESKTPVAADLSTAQWQELDLAIRDRAFFSARVDDIRTTAAMQDKITQALKVQGMDRSRFIAEMRQMLGAAPGDSGELTDLTSYKRLGLIYDFNVEDAMSYGRWRARQDKDLLDAYPCDELIRIAHREVPRGYRKGAGGRLVEVPNESWPARWAAAGGEFYGGRMIALKNDPIWTKISRFGRPWPPFDFNSGMGLMDISREDAEQMGIMAANAPAPVPQNLDFNHNLKSTIEPTPGTMEGLRQVFGDQVDIAHDGTVTWQGQRLLGLYKAALADKSNTWSLNLGSASPEAVQLADQVGVDLHGAELVIAAGDVRHIAKRHGEGNEKDPSQRGVTPLDIQLIPVVWREPDTVAQGHDSDTLQFTKDLLGTQVLITYDRHGNSPTWAVQTLWVKEEGTP